MGGTVFTDGKPGVSGADLDVEIRIADRIADDFKSPSGREDRKAAGEDGFSRSGETGRHAHHVRFRDAGIEMPFRADFFCFGGFC